MCFSFEERVCGIQNALIAVFDKNHQFVFKRGKDTNFFNRTEDLISMFKTKNYYNDHYWLSKNKGNSSYTSNTLSNDKLFSIIDELEDGKF